MPAPTNTQELETRFHGYQRALRDMELLVVAYADDLRRRFKLSRAEVGDPNAWRDPLVSPDCAKVVAGETPTAPRVLRPYGAWGSPACLVPPEQLPGTPLKRRTPRQG
jgi:hypothetical protein